MASLQKKSDSYYCQFCYHGRRHTFTVGAVEQAEAENKARHVDYLLMRLKQRLVVLPEGTDIVTFIEHDGKPPDTGPTLADSPRQAVTLGHLKDRYLTTHSNGTIEANSLGTCKLHLGHFVRILGDGYPIGELSLGKMQEYVNHRAKAKISPVTIRKEIATLRAAWNWGEPMDLTEGKFPNRGLRYPKGEEKPPFMTIAEIEQQIANGSDPSVLWEAVYLLLPEIDELLKAVKVRAIHSFIYPLFCFAAHTGARRSEILRAKVSDLDFGGESIVIHERKRSKGQRTTRRVPIDHPAAFALSRQTREKVEPSIPSSLAFFIALRRSVRAWIASSSVISHPLTTTVVPDGNGHFRQLTLTAGACCPFRRVCLTLAASSLRVTFFASAANSR
jgi:integrase